MVARHGAKEAPVLTIVTIVTDHQVFTRWHDDVLRGVAAITQPRRSRVRAYVAAVLIAVAAREPIHLDLPRGRAVHHEVLVRAELLGREAHALVAPVTVDTA